MQSPEIFPAPYKGVVKRGRKETKDKTNLPLFKLISEKSETRTIKSNKDFRCSNIILYDVINGC